MTLPTGGINTDNYKVYVDNDTYDPDTMTDITSYVNSIEVSGGEREIVEEHVLGEQNPLVSPGRPAAINVAMRVLYTETGGEPAALLQSWYENNTQIYVCLMPKGKTAPNRQYLGQGYVTNPFIPPANSESAGKIWVTINARLSNMPATAYS
jgi:hypothetical protein